jgi:hypothetical protein
MIDTLNEKQRETLKAMIREGVDSKYRQQAEKDLQRDISTRAKEEFEMPKREFNMLVNIAYNQNGREIDKQTSEILDLAQELGFYIPEEE